MKVLLVIPCYKCEAQIVRVIDSLAAKSDLLNRIEKILILDNQSPDQTAQMALQKVRSLSLEQKITVAINDQNYGLGGTHKVGFYHAATNGFDYMAIFHGDDQADAADLVTLITKAQEKPEMAAILGARFMTTSKLQGYSPTRILGNLVFNALYSLVTHRIIWDLGSGINLFKISEHEWESLKRFSHQFSFNYDLILYYGLMKKKISYVPVTWRETDQVSNVRNIHIGMKALKILSNYLFLRKLTSEDPRASYTFSKL